MLMPLQRQIRGHERAKCAEGMEEHLGKKRMARHDAGRFAVIHGMDGRSVFDGIELALRFHRALDPIVIIHSNRLDPRHALQLLMPAIIRRTISNRRDPHAPGLLLALERATGPASWFAPM